MFNSHLLKKKRIGGSFKKSDKELNEVYNKVISAAIQRIEWLFNWGNKLSKLKTVLKIRSTCGLLLHIYCKLIADLIILTKF